MPKGDLAVATELLRTHGVDCGPEGLARVLESLPRTSLRRRELLCTEGDPSGSMWVLLSGSVQVIKRDYSGRAQKLAVLRAPAVVGHMGVVGGNPRSASCEAKTRIEVAVVDKERFQALLSELSPAADAFRRLLISGMSRQLATGNAALRRLLREAGPYRPS